MSTFADFSDILHEPTCSRAYALYVCAADFFYTHIGANANCCNTIEESLARVSGPKLPNASIRTADKSTSLRQQLMPDTPLE